MAVFTIILGHFAKVPSHGLPYHLLVLTGLVPWQFFSNVVAESALCIVGNEPLIKKVYFPRLVLPLSVIPNAGLPLNTGVGEAVYPLEPAPMAEALAEFVKDFGAIIRLHIRG